MSEYQSPVYKIVAVPVEKVVANDYNPNIVAPPEMKLLELSIWEDGYTMPCVCYYVSDKDQYELVDGYHRYLVLKTSRRIYEREKGLLPQAARGVLWNEYVSSMDIRFWNFRKMWEADFRQLQVLDCFPWL